MSNSEENRSPEESTDQKFSHAAEDLGFKLESMADERNRPVGALILPFMARPIVSVERPTSAPQPGIGDEEAIKAVIQAWETAAPNAESVLNTWDAYGSEPVIGLAPGFLAPIDRNVVLQAVESDKFKEQEQKHPFFNPRRVTIDGLSIVFAGPTLAHVSYRFEEEFTNGEVFASNSFAALMKNPKGQWKVTLFSKRLWFIDLQPVTLNDQP